MFSLNGFSKAGRTPVRRAGPGRLDVGARWSVAVPWRAPLHVVVDLTLLLPAGMNGGIRPGLFELLAAWRRREGGRVRVTWLTNTWTHGDLAPLRLTGDRAFCIKVLEGRDPDRASLQPGDVVQLDPPDDLVEQLSPDLFYAPLCEELRSCGSVPALVLHADLLHRDFPASLAPAEVARREAFFSENLRRAAVVQTISHFSARRLAECYGLDSGRIVVTYLPVHRERETAWQASAEVRTWLQDGPYWLYPANFWIHKNHSALLAGYGRYVEQAGAGAWRLALTGHDDESARMMLAAAPKAGGRWRFFGHLPTGDFVALLRGAAGLVFPSHYEGFGIPVLEAMAVGVPVLVSRAGSIPEVCGDAAAYFDQIDATGIARGLAKFEADPASRAILRRRGLRRAAEFSVEREALLLAAAMRSLVRVAGRQ
jgi:glycosyltransferase involved in cell wall biosynthesis